MMLGKGPILGPGNGSDDAQKQSYPGKAAGPVIGKEKSSKAPSGDFAHGGSTKMFNGSSSAPQKPGTSAQQFSGGEKYLTGGNGKMFHEGMGAAPAKAGTSSPNGPGMDGKFASGGSTKMFGPQQAGPATAGHSVK